jgi:ectoine hydroxylase-related dioxygenase (phytanoyl-CoA dioxygenase family)
MTTASLPALTTDLEQAKRDFEEHGYCLVANALTPEEVKAARDRLIEVAFEEAEAGTAFIDGGGANQRVWTLLNKGPEFVALAQHPLALKMMDHIMGQQHHDWYPGDDLPQYLLGSITANIAGPGGDRMHIHTDQFYVPHPWPSFPLVTNIAWLLDDATVENGATRFIPGTHKLITRPGPEDHKRSIGATAPAGTAAFFDGRLWHGTGANTTKDQKRHVILSYYTKPWIRTQENHTLTTKPEVVANATPTLRRLMGFDLYLGLGMMHGLAPTPMQPAAHHRRQ